MINVEKYVQVGVDGYGGPVWDDADDPASAPLLSETDGDPQFLYEVSTDVPLSGIVLVDDNGTSGYGGELDDFNPVYVSGDDGDGVLEFGETWIYTATGTWEAELQTNVATATGTFIDGSTVEDTDAANYFGVAEPDVTGPGVRTPGFWSQEKWQDFWDGDDSAPKQAGDPGFAEGDILLSSGTTDGLLIGDYNRDGLSDDENTIFLSLEDAQRILDASGKEAHDTQYVLGRDVVATWLNYLAGNPIEDGDASTTDPKDYIDDAIAWLKFTTGGSGNPMEPSAVPASSTEWNTGIDLGGDGTIDIPAGSLIHAALDEYNNTGMINGVTYASDADSIL